MEIKKRSGTIPEIKYADLPRTNTFGVFTGTRGPGKRTNATGEMIAGKTPNDAARKYVETLRVR